MPDRSSETEWLREADPVKIESAIPNSAVAISQRIGAGWRHRNRKIRTTRHMTFAFRSSRPAHGSRVAGACGGRQGASPSFQCNDFADDAAAALHGHDFHRSLQGLDLAAMHRFWNEERARIRRRVPTHRPTARGSVADRASASASTRHADDAQARAGRGWYCTTGQPLFRLRSRRRTIYGALFHSRWFAHREKHRPYYSNVAGMVDKPPYRHVVTAFNIPPFDLIIGLNVQQVLCPLANLLHSSLTGPVESLRTSDNRSFDKLRSRGSE